MSSEGKQPNLRINFIFRFLQVLNEIEGAGRGGEEGRELPCKNQKEPSLSQFLYFTNYYTMSAAFLSSAMLPCVLHIIKMQNPLASANVVSQGDWCSSNRQEMRTCL